MTFRLPTLGAKRPFRYKVQVPAEVMIGKERKGKERNGRKGKEKKGTERKGKERKGKERKGKERKEKERKGKERKGKERKGKERKGKERKGKERKGKIPFRCSLFYIMLYNIFAPKILIIVLQNVIRFRAFPLRKSENGLSCYCSVLITPRLTSLIILAESTQVITILVTSRWIRGMQDMESTEVINVLATFADIFLFLTTSTYIMNPA